MLRKHRLYGWEICQHRQASIFCPKDEWVKNHQAFSPELDLPLDYLYHSFMISFAPEKCVLSSSKLASSDSVRRVQKKARNQGCHFFPTAGAKKATAAAGVLVFERLVGWKHIEK